MATLLLVLANLINQDISTRSLIDVGKTTLNDMSHSGNLPAKSLNQELDYICKLISDFPRHAGKSSCSLMLHGFETLIHDGHVLSDAVLNVIVWPADGSSNNDINVQDVSSSDYSTLNQRQQLEAPLSCTAGPIESHLQSSFFIPSVDTTMHPNDVYLDHLHTMENQYSFATEDLQWLDLV